MNRQAGVHLALASGTIRAGTAYFHETRGTVSTTFTYNQEYLTRRDAYPVDPDLPLLTGPHATTGLPGAFQDCSPDRWGRNLIQKQHRALRRGAGSPPRTLTDVDYLLGVSDETRQGALRFSRPEDEGFVAGGAHVPPLLSLPALQAAADRITPTGGDDSRAVQELLGAGTGSLGGARPKASVRGDDGSLLMAKFTHESDQWSIIRWEKTALDIAEKAGIQTPTRSLLTVGGRPVLLLTRFDRDGDRRIGYMSAMTAVGSSDGDLRDYVDFAEALEGLAADPHGAAESLFRRVVLNVAIRNTDDHLRNHGLLREPAGWSLTPVFDINPEPDLAKERTTAIFGAAAGDAEAEALREFADACRVPGDRANAVIGEVCAAVSHWEVIARSNGVPESEIEMFADVFHHQLSRLRELRQRQPGGTSEVSTGRSDQARVPRGLPGGGQFTAKQRDSSG